MEQNIRTDNFAQQIDANGNATPAVGWGTPQTVDGSASSAQSTVLDANAMSLARLVATDADCWVLIGSDPTAVADTCVFMPKYSIEHVKVPAGYKIAVLGGNLNITPCR